MPELHLSTAVAEDSPRVALAPPPPPPATSEPDAPGGRFSYKWLALGVVLLGSIMTILDSTIVNIAVPSLQTAFNVTRYNDIAWVITGYLLAQGAVIPMAGWATDRFGTKRLYIGTLVLFTLASALCGLAPNLGALIFFRVLQGVGGGMIMPIGMTIILNVVGPRQMGKVMSIFGIPMLLAPALGPVLGGWFVQDFSWRLIFYVNIPIGIIAVVMAARVLQETAMAHRLRLDVIGVLTAVPATVALLYGVDRSSELGWGSPTVLVSIGLAVVLLAAFIVRQLKAEEPLLNLELFRDSTFSWAMVISLVVVTSLFGGMLLLPLFLQQVHGYDALHAGLVLLPQAIAAALFMPIGGYLVDRFGPRVVVPAGLVLLTLGSVVLAQLNPDTPLWVLMTALVLRGAAMGLAMMQTMSAALARVPRHLTSRASSVTNTLQRVSSSIGIAVLVTFLSAQVGVASSQATCAPSPAAVAGAAAAQNAPQLTAAQLCTGLQARFAGSGSNLRSQGTQASSGSPAFDSFLHDYVNKAMSISFDRTFVFIAIISALGVVPAFFLKKPEQPAEPGSAMAFEG